MKIEKCEWKEQFVEKLEVKHGVYPEEVEDAIESRFYHAKFRKLKRGKRRGEDLFRAFGRTKDGRYLFIVFIYKPRQRIALIISARDMDKSERKQYERK